MSSAMMRPIHLSMARAALGWTVRDLEKKSGVGRNAISRYEMGKDILASALQKLEEVLAHEGIVFFEDDKTYGTGIKVKKQQRPR
jgi:transcriptional regulator with XRE-family HTH domain